MILLQILQKSESARTAASPLLSRLTKVAAEGSAKVAQRAEGVKAALAIALAASTGSKLESSVPASWDSVADVKAPLLSAATLAKLTPEDASFQLYLAESLLLQARSPKNRGHFDMQCAFVFPMQKRSMTVCVTFSRVPYNCMKAGHINSQVRSTMQHAVRLGPDGTQQCVRLIATAALHHAKVVRQTARRVAAYCVKQALPLAGNFITAFQELLRLAPDIPVRIQVENITGLFAR